MALTSITPVVRRHTTGRPVRSRALLVAAAAALFATNPSHAAMVAYSGAVTPIAPPGDVNQGELESNIEAFVFREQLATTLAVSLSIDIKSAGTYTSSSSPISGKVDAGTVIDSYHVHMDRVGTGGSLRYAGSMTFDTTVLGIISSTNRLNLADPIVGFSGTIYPTAVSGIDRGSLDTAGSTEFIQWSGRIINFDLGHGSDNIEHFRVITAGSAVPVPGMAALFGVVAIVLAGRRRYQFPLG